MIDINELRDGVSKFGGGYLTDSGWSDLIDRLEAAEKERDDLRAKIEEAATVELLTRRGRACVASEVAA